MPINKYSGMSKEILDNKLENRRNRSATDREIIEERTEHRFKGYYKFGTINYQEYIKDMIDLIEAGADPNIILDEAAEKHPKILDLILDNKELLALLSQESLNSALGKTVTYHSAQRLIEAGADPKIIFESEKMFKLDMEAINNKGNKKDGPEYSADTFDKVLMNKIYDMDPKEQIKAIETAKYDAEKFAWLNEWARGEQQAKQSDIVNYNRHYVLSYTISLNSTESNMLAKNILENLKENDPKEYSSFLESSCQSAIYAGNQDIFDFIKNSGDLLPAQYDQILQELFNNATLFKHKDTMEFILKNTSEEKIGNLATGAEKYVLENKGVSSENITENITENIQIDKNQSWIEDLIEAILDNINKLLGHHQQQSNERNVSTTNNNIEIGRNNDNTISPPNKTPSSNQVADRGR